MNVNGITNVTTNVTEAYSAYTSKTSVTKEAENSTSKAVNEGVVYEPSEVTKQQNEEKQAVKLEKNKELKAQLQADQEARMAQLQSIVFRTINKQTQTYGQANDIWSILSSGNFTVDAATKAQAQADIAEDGYWGVEATSNRIIDFAVALCGDDPDKLEEMKEAFEKGFRQAEETWGGKLPDICQRTYDRVFEKFDNLINPQEKATEVTQ